MPRGNIIQEMAQNQWPGFPADIAGNPNLGPVDILTMPNAVGVSGRVTMQGACGGVASTYAVASEGFTGTFMTGCLMFHPLLTVGTMTNTATITAPSWIAIT